MAGGSPLDPLTLLTQPSASFGPLPLLTLRPSWPSVPPSPPPLSAILPSWPYALLTSPPLSGFPPSWASAPLNPPPSALLSSLPLSALRPSRPFVPRGPPPHSPPLYFGHLVMTRPSRETGSAAPVRSSASGAGAPVISVPHCGPTPRASATRGSSESRSAWVPSSHPGPPETTCLRSRGGSS